jgi:endonuclease/exonuclease/phosphatase family metal-dependent hydrolase
MTFNIRYDNPMDGVDAWPNRATWVADVIRQSDVAAFGLQEALHHQADTVAALLPGYRWVGVGRTDGEARGEFAPVFYDPDRLQLDRWDTIWLSETPAHAGSIGWDAALPRIATRAWFTIRSTGGRFVMANVHMDHRGRVARERSASLLADSLAGDYPAVLLGDFNFVDSTAAYAEIMSSGMADSFLAAGRPDPEETFTGFDADAEPGTRRIDYVFVNGPSILSYEALDRERGGRFVSDHRPVVVTLGIGN